MCIYVPSPSNPLKSSGPMQQLHSCHGSVQSTVFASGVGDCRILTSLASSLGSSHPFFFGKKLAALLPVPCTGKGILQVSYMDPSTPGALAVAALLLCLCHADQPSDCWQPTSPRGGQNPSGRAGTSEEIAPNCSHRAWRKRFDGFTEENGWEGIDKHTERSN